MDTFFNNLTSNYEVFFNPAASCQMDGITTLYNYIMSYLTAILFVVTTALVFIIVTHLHGSRHLKQFKKEENLEDILNWLRFVQRWTHSTTLELVWTVIPTIILIAIAIPSFILLYSLDEIVDTQSIVKVIGFQWYWKYEYPVLNELQEDVVTFSYLSYMLPFDDLTTDKNRRLLEVDSPLILPTNVNSKLVITAKDVLHSFAVPALGLKMDAVPGRLNQITVHIFKSGMFYGQCSELCGVNHGFMPIVVAAVDLPTFEQFLAKCAGLDKTTVPEINEDNLPTASSSGDDENPSSSKKTVISYQFTSEDFKYIKLYNSIQTPDGVTHQLEPIENHYAYYLADAPYLEGEEKLKLIEKLLSMEEYISNLEIELNKFLIKINFDFEALEDNTVLKPYLFNYLQNLLNASVVYNHLLQLHLKGDNLISPQSFYVREYDFFNTTLYSCDGKDEKLVIFTEKLDLLYKLERIVYILNELNELFAKPNSSFHENNSKLDEELSTDLLPTNKDN